MGLAVCEYCSVSVCNYPSLSRSQSVSGGEGWGTGLERCGGGGGVGTGCVSSGSLACEVTTVSV